MPDVLRIETRVVDPPAPTTSPSSAPASMRCGACRAIANCGPWPEVATTAQYMDAITAASDEVDRAAALWSRYARRFDLLDFAIESGPPRLGARFMLPERSSNGAKSASAF